MTDVITLDERKGTEKCKPRLLLSAIPMKMLLSGKERWEIVKIYCPNGQNAAQTLRVYHRNHGLRQAPCIVKAVRDLIHKFEETSCTCDWSQFGWPSCRKCWRNSSDDKHSSSRKCTWYFSWSAPAKFNCPQGFELCLKHVSVFIPAYPDFGSGRQSITARFC